MTLFIDGIPTAKQALPQELADLNMESGDPTWDGAYYIGSTWPDRGTGSFFNRYFHGHLAGAALYNHPLTEAEIQRLAQEEEVR